MKCNQINLEQNGTLELGGNACYGQICCSVGLFNVFFLFVFSIIYTNNIAGKCNKAGAEVEAGGAGEEQLPAQLISSRMKKARFVFS